MIVGVHVKRNVVVEKDVRKTLIAKAAGVMRAYVKPPHAQMAS